MTKNNKKLQKMTKITKNDKKQIKRIFLKLNSKKYRGENRWFRKFN